MPEPLNAQQLLTELAGDHEWDTMSLHQPSPNCRFAGFIGPAPDLLPNVEPVDFMALQQLLGDEEDGAEVVVATRVVPLIIDAGGRMQILRPGAVAPDGTRFACVAGDENHRTEYLTTLIGLERNAARPAAAAATPAVDPENTEVSDAT
jgi:hypothetical protein